MRIFITGASGFLGDRVLLQLKGHEILSLSRNPEKIVAKHDVCIIKGDLHNPGEWQSELERFAPQWCMHLAWEGLPDYSFSRCRINLDASLKLLEILSHVGMNRIVIAGSCWEYGSVGGAVRESQPVNSCGIFASTKHSLRIMLESMARENGFEYRWARIFFSYGPGQRATSLMAQCHAAFSKGKAPDIRSPSIAQDFVYVDDVAQGLVSLTESDAPSGVYNIGSGKPTTVGYVVNRVASHFDMLPLFSTQVADSGFWADTLKMTTASGWKARMGIDEGIALTLSALDKQ